MCEWCPSMDFVIKWILDYKSFGETEEMRTRNRNREIDYSDERRNEHQY